MDLHTTLEQVRALLREARHFGPAARLVIVESGSSYDDEQTHMITNLFVLDAHGRRLTVQDDDAAHALLWPHAMMQRLEDAGAQSCLLDDGNDSWSRTLAIDLDNLDGSFSAALHTGETS